MDFRQHIGRLVRGLGVFLLVLVGMKFVQFYPDLLWFESFGYGSVWWIEFKAKLVTFLAFFGISFGFLIANIGLAKWISARHRIDIADIQFSARFEPFKAIFTRYDEIKRSSPLLSLPGKVLSIAVFIGLVFFSYLQASVAKSWWQEFYAFFRQTAFGTTDPIFGKDLGFYFFSLPVFEHLQNWVMVLVMAAFVFSAWVYFTENILVMVFARHRGSAIKAHLFVLGAIVVGLIAADAYLSMFGLLHSTRGIVFGAGYADIHAQLVAYKAVLVALAIEAVIVLVYAFRPGIRVPAIGFAAVFGLWVVLGNIYPGMIQSYVVSPNEVQKESPYILHNIAFTRLGFNLHNIVERPFPVTDSLTSQDIARNPSTIRNIRLWNKEPLKQTFSQLQEIRLYYEFLNVDVDRYRVNGGLQQVMLSAREMEPSQLASQAQTWLNRHLTYTHGYGIAMSPVNEVTEDGLPRFYIKDLPPSSDVDISVTRPEIYFGEKSLDYVVVNTGQKEFDYPKGDKNVYTHYQGKGGVVLDSFLKRFIYSLKYSNIKFLISPLIKPDSRIMYDRDIRSIVQGIAPFLIYDPDPYLVVSESGRLVWMWDAYTASDMMPYSEPFKSRSGAFNYIRNSVKVTVDAYSGETLFYVADAKDPLIQTYAKVYPGLFKAFDQMPTDLMQHIRYPKGLFTVQAAMYRTYHMTDPQVFYNREDVWSIPKETYEENEQVMEAYYTVMKVPGESEAAFILMLPFTPTNKNNMIAWLSANCNPEKYGQLTVFKFPKEKTIYGPMQIESRIDQDTEISERLTLWGQVGSRVIRGNLMVIPIEQSLIYVEPIYLQATQSKLPELKRVVFAYNDKVVMEQRLEDAIQSVFSGYVETPSLSSKLVSQIKSVGGSLGHNRQVRELSAAFKELKRRAKVSDWSGFGQSLETVEKLIDRLAKPSRPASTQ